MHSISLVEAEVSLWKGEILGNGVATTCAELGIPVLAYSPLGTGFLTGQYTSKEGLSEKYFRTLMPRWQPGVIEKDMELVKEVKKIADRKSVTPAQLAMAWLIKQGQKPGMPVIIPIPGTSKIDRVTENATVPELTDEGDKEVEQMLTRTNIEGGSYPDFIAHLSFGKSPPLQSPKMGP